MKVIENVNNGIAVLTVKGNMMGGPDSQKLHEVIKSLVIDRISKIVVNLSGVKYMNSSGLGILMASFGTVAQVEGMIRLVGATDKIKSVLIMTQLIQFFDTYETVDRAIASFV